MIRVTDKIYVLYITSEEMSKRWNAVLEVGAGWITQSSHKIFNILDYTQNRSKDSSSMCMMPSLILLVCHLGSLFKGDCGS
jgi:hypothetical protein